MKLYWGPYTRTIGIHLLLEEIGSSNLAGHLDRMKARPAVAVAMRPEGEPGAPS